MSEARPAIITPGAVHGTSHATAQITTAVVIPSPGAAIASGGTVTLTISPPVVAPSKRIVWATDFGTIATCTMFGSEISGHLVNTPASWWLGAAVGYAYGVKMCDHDKES